MRVFQSPTRVLLLTAMVVVALGGGADVGAASSGAPSPTVPGSASASGTVASARLFYGGLSLPLGVGTTAASYTNTQSRALGAALDLAAYASLVTDSPPQASPMVIDSNAGDREESRDLGAGDAVGRVDLRATQVPASSSEVRMTDLSLPALVRVEGAHSRSSTEFRDGRQRRASSVVDIARVSIADGLVVLENLRWEADHRTGTEPTADGAFTIGTARIAGFPVPLPADDLVGALDAANAVLRVVGLRVEAPSSAQTPEGAVTVSPLRVTIADSALGTALLGPIIASARPLLTPALEAVTDVDSSLGLVGLVADLVLGVADGSGGIEVSVGGATATTSESGSAPTIPAPADAPASAAEDVVDSTAASTAGGTVAVPPTPPAPSSSKARAEVALDVPTLAVTSVRCALEAAPLRRGGCRDSNLFMAVGISGVAVAVVASVEVRTRRRRNQGAEST